MDGFLHQENIFFVNKVVRGLNLFPGTYHNTPFFPDSCLYPRAILLNENFICFFILNGLNGAKDVAWLTVTK
jgi:hypothetical protein